jgi:hypothetical protein
MTRKDFELLAGALRTARRSTENKEGVDIAIQNIAWSIASEHPRFKKELFMIKAGHMEEKRAADMEYMMKALSA